MDPHSFYLLDPNPEPHSEKLLDPDPQNMNADPQPCHGFFIGAFVSLSVAELGGAGAATTTLQ